MEASNQKRSKHRYQLIINTADGAAYQYRYRFGQTEITLALAEDSVSVSMEMNPKSEKQFCDMLRSGEGSDYFTNAINDALKHSFLLHIIKYSKHIHVRTVLARIDEEESEIYHDGDEKLFPIYSMLNGSLLRELPERWRRSEGLAGNLLTRRKSRYNSLDSALFALLYAKSKAFETERLVYLWMAMNGLYDHLVHLGSRLDLFDKKSDNIPKISTSGESDRMKIFSRFYGWGTEHITQKTKTDIARKVIPILVGYEGSITKEMLLPDANGEYTHPLAEAIRSCLNNAEGKPYDITPYGYLMLWLPYYFRCNVFHANNPIDLFSYADEANIRCLQIVNQLMEEFIEATLPEWYEDAFAVSFAEQEEQPESALKSKLLETFSP